LQEVRKNLVWNIRDGEVPHTGLRAGIGCRPIHLFLDECFLGDTFDVLAPFEAVFFTPEAAGGRFEDFLDGVGERGFDLAEFDFWGGREPLDWGCWTRFAAEPATLPTAVPTMPPRTAPTGPPIIAPTNAPVAPPATVLPTFVLPLGGSDFPLLMGLAPFVVGFFDFMPEA
jgi:hypothetical protein